MIRLSTILVASITIAWFQSASFAHEVAGEKATTGVSTKLEQMINRLQAIEERLRRIESQFDSIKKRSNIQNLDPPIKCVFVPSPGAVPGREVVPGQILGHIEPRQRGQMISPWLEPGTVIKTIDAFDGDFKRK